jgi:hypothetical protein
MRQEITTALLMEDIGDVRPITSFHWTLAANFEQN